MFWLTPHSPDWAPSDYRLFTRLKEALGGKRFENNEELQQFTKAWLKGVAGDIYESGIQKLIPQYRKCIEIMRTYTNI